MSTSANRVVRRKPRGPNGTPRDKPFGFKLAKAEVDLIYELLRARGYEPNGTGARALLLKLATENPERVTAAA